MCIMLIAKLFMVKTQAKKRLCVPVQEPLALGHRYRRLAALGVASEVVETVYDKLFNVFGLWRERPHEIGGLRARLAARVALHNFCIRLNDQLGRPRLKFALLIGW
jgi:hypothetical protein